MDFTKRLESILQLRLFVTGVYMVNIHDASILKLCINQSRHEARRVHMETEFRFLNLDVQRIRGINPSLVKNIQQCLTEEQYAYSLSLRLALRYARKSRAEVTCIFEDDLEFHKDFARRISQVDLPGHWGIVLLGTCHRMRPQPVAPGLVRVHEAIDFPAFIVRREYIPEILSALRHFPIKEGEEASVVEYSRNAALRQVTRIVPTYAFFPNVVWRRDVTHVNREYGLSMYAPDGKQRIHADAIRGIEIDWLCGADFTIGKSHANYPSMLSQGAPQKRIYIGRRNYAVQGWIGLCYADLDHLHSLPIVTSSIHEIILDHVLERLEPSAVISIMAEVARILTKGGMIQIRYTDTSTIFLRDQFLEDDRYILDEKLKSFYHCESVVSTWTHGSLKRILWSNGFSVVEKSPCNLFGAFDNNCDLFLDERDPWQCGIEPSVLAACKVNQLLNDS